jgi:hypothetical protein
MQMGEDEDDDNDDEWEPVEPITSPCGGILGYCQKVGLNRW